MSLLFYGLPRARILQYEGDWTTLKKKKKRHPRCITIAYPLADTKLSLNNLPSQSQMRRKKRAVYEWWIYMREVTIPCTYSTLINIHDDVEQSRQFLFKYNSSNNTVIDKIKFCLLKIFFVLFLKSNSFYIPCKHCL